MSRSSGDTKDPTVDSKAEFQEVVCPVCLEPHIEEAAFCPACDQPMPAGHVLCQSCRKSLEASGDRVF